MGGFVAYNGQFVSDDDLDAWEEIYARGEFPEGEHSVGEVINGAPGSQGESGASGKSNEPDRVTLSVEIPAAMERAIVQVAKRKNLTTGEYVQNALLKSLVEA